MVAQTNGPPPLVAVASSGTWSPPASIRGVGKTLAEVSIEEAAAGPPSFVAEGLLEAGDVVLLAGEEKKTLKTWLMLDFAIVRIDGGEWLGFRVAACAPERGVLIVETETKARQVLKRAQMLCAGRGIPFDRIAPYLVVVDAPLPLLPVDGKVEKKQQERLGKQRHLGTVASRAPRQWGFIGVDSLRDNLLGSENDSDDARAFIAGARSNARISDCPLMLVHHTGKGGGHGARAARGSVQFTAGADVILTATSSDPCRIDFSLRNHEEPPAITYRLEVDKALGTARVVAKRTDEERGGGDGVTDDEVLAVLDAFDEEQPRGALALAKIRARVSEARGCKPGSKASQPGVQAALGRLAARGEVAETMIETKNGKRFPGWRLGSDSSPDRARSVGQTRARPSGSGTGVQVAEHLRQEPNPPFG